MKKFAAICLAMLVLISGMTVYAEETPPELPAGMEEGAMPPELPEGAENGGGRHAHRRDPLHGCG